MSGGGVRSHFRPSQDPTRGEVGVGALRLWQKPRAGEGDARQRLAFARLRGHTDPQQPELPCRSLAAPRECPSPTRRLAGGVRCALAAPRERRTRALRPPEGFFISANGPTPHLCGPGGRVMAKKTLAKKALI